ncbi:polyphosphate kinase 2 family protein [Geomonas sp. Red32]|uniref:polyphosphate kinase 2 family protein n=1 Tax=Geomonas sp. Red32 TaxID=2912856 RepID=UPI00202CC0C7|nr:polyphosphate kinase 2 family protein [Geomonas sp. Red32]MCM0082932.1 polyphosphate kinase 2 family protein [Geomonas sp. Red32]
MDYLKRFMVEPGKKVKLDKIDPSFKDRHQDHASAQGEIDGYTSRLRELQYLLYAEGRHSLLIILQALDAGGKDGTINHVLGNMNPQGSRVCSFKAPTPKELAHDFLWRIHQEVPKAGEVVVFNRSQYEDVLAARVHQLVPKKIWQERYRQINDFEQLLAENGTRILKFYLHIGKEEQLRRFRQRLEDPARHWKISEADYREREHWEEYQDAYEDALSLCSTPHAPWFVIPADHKWFRNLAVSQIVVRTLESLKMSFPEPAVDLAEISRRFHRELEAEERENGAAKRK